YPFTSLTTFSDTSLGKFLQLKHGLPNRPIVQMQNTIILIECDHRHRLRRCNREVVKDAPVGLHLVVCRTTDRIHPLAKLQSSCRMIAFTQGKEGVLRYLPCQSQLIGTLSEPFSSDFLPLG